MAGPGTVSAAGVGSTLHHGRYRLEEALGKGATAVVWRATDSVLGVQRAVKVLSLRAAGSHALRRRLLAEARAMAQLKHPNILRVYDIGFDGERDFVVMELAEQGSLADWVDAYGPMPPDMALPYMVQVLSALQAAHARGIVHRDVKPQNILLDGEGTALLADFGIALLAEDQLRTTRTGVAMGSLAFMAPEQRLDARSVKPAADVYAAGTTLYNLLTAANPVDLFAADERSGRWAGIPEDLATLLRRAASYAPADRYDDARHMAEALTQLLESAGTEPLQTPADAPALPGHQPGAARSLKPPPRDLRPNKAAVSTAITLMAADLDSDVEPLELPELPVVHSATAVVEDLPEPPATSQDSLAWMADEQQVGGGRVLPLAAALLVMVGMAAVAWWTTEDIADMGVDAAADGTAAESAAAESAAAESAAAESAAAEPSDEDRSDARGSAQPGSSTLAEPASRPATVAAGTDRAGPERRPSGPASVAAGTWKGNVHVQSGKLVLQGSDAHLSGLLTTTNPSTRVSRTVAVSGRYDGGSRTLFLEEQVDPDEDPTAGRYEAELSQDGATLAGTYHALVGRRTASIKLSRSSG